MTRIYVPLDKSMTDQEIVDAFEEAAAAENKTKVAKTLMRSLAKVNPADRRTSIAKIAVFNPDLNVTELDVDKNLVFGWASISIQKDGTQLSDLQGHSIDIDDLEQAAYNFTIDYRKTGEMHGGEALGDMVESFVVTPDKLEQMGLAPDALPLGWWVGFKVPPTVFAKVKTGKYRMFSIQGKATLEQI